MWLEEDTFYLNAWTLRALGLRDMLTGARIAILHGSPCPVSGNGSNDSRKTMGLIGRARRAQQSTKETEAA